MNNALITDEQRVVLLANGRKSLENPDFDPAPVVKLFTPDAGATWLLTEIDPDDHDHAFGLCDLGLGAPEIGWVSLGELATVRGGLGGSLSDLALGAPQGAPCALCFLDHRRRSMP